MNVIQQKFQIIEGQNPEIDGKLNDMLSSLYTFSFNLSSLLAPIIGGALYDATSYWKTIDINMIATSSVAIIFIIFNCGFSVIKRHKILEDDV